MGIDELRTLIARHAPAGTTMAMDGVYVARETTPGPPELATTGTTFALVVQGAKQVVLGDQSIDYTAGQYLVTSIDLPVVGRYTDANREVPALGFGMTLTSSAIAELLLSSGTPTPLRSSRTAAVPALAVSSASAELLDAITRLLRLLERPRDRSVLAPMIKREILWLLITGPQGETVRQLGLADSSVTQIGRAVQWIRENSAEPMRVVDLADLVGLSVSAFHRNFHAVTGASPLRFQKLIRLHNARQALAANDDDVAQVAYAVGYESSSHFSREYRHHFGNPPGRDRARMRDATGRQ